VTKKEETKEGETKEGDDKKKKKKKTKTTTGDAKKTTHFNIDAKRDLLEAQEALKKKQKKKGI